MVRSMTGYGKAVKEYAEQTISLEMKSINHRFLDISFKMPRHLLPLEDEMKRMMKKLFGRGKIEVYIHLSGQRKVQRNLQVDWNLLNQYMKRLEEMQHNYAIQGNISVDSLLQIPDLFEIEENDTLEGALKEGILTALEEAMDELETMRQQEGTFLLKDLRERLQQISRLTTEIEALQPVVANNYKERIEKRIRSYIEDLSELDEVRLHQEIAILVEKGDITEEIVRLKSHVIHMEKTLEEQGSIGRKLDFICQEMHREANTIGSKASDGALNKIDVLLKSEIEKIKEQVQNIE